jgi:hypothetical protein
MVGLLSFQKYQKNGADDGGHYQAGVALAIESGHCQKILFDTGYSMAARRAL